MQGLETILEVVYNLTHLFVSNRTLCALIFLLCMYLRYLKTCKILMYVHVLVCP